jgi:hypothetical protein
MAHMAPVAENSRPYFLDDSVQNEGRSSAVSWAAIIAGAFVASALSLSLLALGTGVGLSSISPWATSGVSATAVGRGAILWLIVIQIIASAIGGYVAGRLRTKWVDVHTDEVYFRDTAHGFLVWAVGLVLSAAFLASAATSIVRGPGAVEGVNSAAPAGQAINPSEYYVDTLLRSSTPSTDAGDASVRSEVAIILANALRQGQMPDADQAYLSNLVATKTGMSPADAQQRVSATFKQALQAADTARKAVAHSLYWLFLALLIGAFCASFAATIGGRQRDHMRAV